MAKIGSLEVRTVGTGVNRVKVVKFPGHEFEIEHFLPENLEEVTELSTRARLVRDKKGSNEFVIKRKYPSKSEFIRNLIMEKLDRGRKEKIGWMNLAEKSMNKIWNNKKDDEAWSKYL